MDTITGVQQRTPTKRSKPKKKKPIKVVYISNPMKVNTSASQFRALVQELTGRHAESPPDPSKFEVSDGDDGGSRCGDRMEYFVKNDNNALAVPPPGDPEGRLGGGSSSIDSFEPFDDVLFTPQIVENISALLPASVFYETHPLLDHCW